MKNFKILNDFMLKVFFRVQHTEKNYWILDDLEIQLKIFQKSSKYSNFLEFR